MTRLLLSTFCQAILWLIFATCVFANEGPALTAALQARELAARGNFIEALELGQNALTLSIDEYPQPHLYTAFILDDLVKYNLQLERLETALEHSENGIRLIEAIGVSAQQFKSDLLFNRATVLSELGRYAEAITAFNEVYLDRQSSANRAKLASVAQSSGFAYMEFRNFELALSRLTESAELFKEIEGDGSPGQIASLIAMAKIPLLQNNASRSITDSLSLRTRYAASLTPLQRSELDVIEADAHIQMSLLAKAESKLNDALAALDLLEQTPSSGYARIYYSRSAIAILRGDPIAAESAIKTNLTLLLETEAESHPVVLRALHALAVANKNIGKLNESDQLFRRVIEVTRRNLGNNHVSVSDSLGEWSRVLIELGRVEQAIDVAVSSLNIIENNTDSTEFQRAIAQIILGFALFADNQYHKANDLLKTGTSLLAKTRTTDSSDLPPGLIALAEISIELKTYDRARQYITRALNIINKDVSSTPDRAIHATTVLARIDALENRCESAVSLLQTAVDYASSYSLNAFKINGFVSDAKTHNDRKYMTDIFDVLDICYGHGFDEPLIKNLAFTAIQIPQLNTTSAAVTKSKLSSSKANERLVNLVDQRDTLRLKWRNLDDRLRASVISDEAENNLTLNDLTSGMAGIAADIGNLNQDIERDFPDFAELLNPTAASLEQLQSVLQNGTAALLQFTTQGYTQLAMVTNTNIQFARTPLTTDTLARAVEDIRQSLKPDVVNDAAGALDFDLENSKFLYQMLIAPFEDFLHLNTITHLLLVPDAAAQRIPFALFLENLPENKPTSLRAFRHYDFLINKYSMSVLPSVSSAIGLAKLPAGNDTSGFIGFGDPVFDNVQEKDTRSKNAYTEYAESRIDLNVLSSAFGRIEETAAELEWIKGLYQDNHSKIYLRDDATEVNVKNASLQDYSVLAFATHGVMADEFASVREPALVFTPPSVITNDDDGLLTASEIAQLNLAADWVILSACNTASPVPELGADGLSGLARAFFYAGAKSLLVTHWEVESYSAQLLSTNAITHFNDSESGLTKSQSLRESMLHLLQGHAGGRYAHPYYWAPFSQIGLQ